MRIILLLLLALITSPAQAYDWEYLAMDGVGSHCIVSDPDHQRVFVGTWEGFHYLDENSDIWTNRDWEGWIGREVHAVDWHPDLDQRVLTGRENGWFKGYLELSDDLGITEDFIYESQGGAVSDMIHDDSYHYACTWPDIAPGEFLRSADGGESWNLLTGHGHYAMTSLELGFADELFLAGDNRVTRSVDNGLTWDQVGTGLSPDLGVYCLASVWPGGDVLPEMSLLASNDQGLFYTENGDNWDQVHTSVFRNIRTFSGMYNVVAGVTFDGRVLVSTDWGGYWEDETGALAGLSPIDVALSPWHNSLYVLTAEHGVYRVEDVITDTPQVPAAPATLDLRAAPNPFNPRTTLSFELESAARVSLEIFDPAGRLMETVIDHRMMGSGGHKLHWNGNDLASGLYLARISAGGEMSVTRLILLK
jgi:hypothetical protein